MIPLQYKSGTLSGRSNQACVTPHIAKPFKFPCATEAICGEGLTAHLSLVIKHPREMITEQPKFTAYFVLSLQTTSPLTIRERAFSW